MSSDESGVSSEFIREDRLLSRQDHQNSLSIGEEAVSANSNVGQHEAGESPFNSEDCLESPSIPNLENQKANHGDRKSYICEICGKNCSSGWTLNRHRKTHSGEKPFKCGQCPKSYPNSWYLTIHKRIHSGEKPYECDLCGSRFANPTRVLEHKKSHAGTLNRYKCDECPSAFRVPSALVSHKRTHTGEKPFQCDLCPKSFRNNSYLLIHKRAHNGEKPYECHLCGCTFSLPSQFTLHKKSHAGVGKPYKCDQCPAAYPVPAGLAEHKRIHTGEKPFQCGTCSTWFRRKSDLRNHEKRVHSCKCSSSELGTNGTKCISCVTLEQKKAELSQARSVLRIYENNQEQSLTEVMNHIKEEVGTHSDFRESFDDQMELDLLPEGVNQGLEDPNRRFPAFEFVSSSSQVLMVDNVFVKVESQGMIQIKEEDMSEDEDQTCLEKW